MMRVLRPGIVVLFVLLPLLGCASHSALKPEDRGYLERAWAGRERDEFLRLSFYVTHFFGDGSKRLLTPVPPDEVRLLDSPQGKPVNPGPIEQTLPAGTKVRILKVEFPTSFVIPQRILYTPRTQPWVFLEVAGQPKMVAVLVLRPELKTIPDARAELERYLTVLDPAPVLANYSPAIREGIRRKEAMEDMPGDALERAWGYPDRIQVQFVEDAREEEWIYPGGKRRAFLRDDRVVRLQTEPSPPSTAGNER